MISSKKNTTIIVILFFAAVLCVGLIVFKDYGMSWDEHVSRYNGVMALKYILENDRSLFTYQDRFYGPVFEIFLVAVELYSDLTSDIRKVFLMRHAGTFLLFYLGIIFFYRTCRYRFKDRKIALLGSFFLILSPRIFAHSFYNSKDMAFLAVFIIGVYSLISYLNKKTFYNAVIHGIICAFLIDIRITGLLLPIFTVIFLFMDLMVIEKEKEGAKRSVATFMVYIIFLISFTVLFWPTLWVDPLKNFIEAFKFMSRHSWPGKVLYFGEYVRASNLPWHYIPVWLFITTPLLYSVLFFTGCLISLKSFVTHPLGFYRNRRDDLVFFTWFFLPLISVIILRSTLYDGWRQMFFIYPAFLIIALIGLTSVFKGIGRMSSPGKVKILNSAVAAAILLSACNVGYSVIKSHPYENVYFNFLAGRNGQEIKNNFELDYWGLSYREALEYVLENDSGKTVKIFVANPSGISNASILKPGYVKRIVFVEDPGKAKYFISNYRWHREEYPYENEFFSISVNGMKIMVVYKL